MNNLDKVNNVFESIKHIDEDGNEFWYARELMKILKYAKWENFHKVIKNAMISCNKSNINLYYHFPDISKMVVTSSSNNNIRYYIHLNILNYMCFTCYI